MPSAALRKPAVNFSPKFLQRRLSGGEKWTPRSFRGISPPSKKKKKRESEIEKEREGGRALKKKRKKRKLSELTLNSQPYPPNRPAASFFFFFKVQLHCVSPPRKARGSRQRKGKKSQPFGCPLCFQPPLPHSQTVLLKFSDKRKTKMAAWLIFKTGQGRHILQICKKREKSGTGRSTRPAAKCANRAVCYPFICIKSHESLFTGELQQV